MKFSIHGGFFLTSFEGAERERERQLFYNIFEVLFCVLAFFAPTSTSSLLSCTFFLRKILANTFTLYFSSSGVCIYPRFMRESGVRYVE